MLKKYQKLITEATKGEEIRAALVDAFKTIDMVTKLILAIQTIQGITLIIIGTIIIWLRR